MTDFEPILFDSPSNVLKKSASFIVKSALPTAGLSGKRVDPEALKPWNQPIGNCSVEEIMKHRVTNLAVEDVECQDAFYVADLGEIARQHLQFRTLLPRVEPFYGMPLVFYHLILEILKIP